MTGIQGKYREHTLSLMEKAGYQRRGFACALRKATPQAEEEEGSPYDRCPTPTAWRKFHETDEHGRQWTIFECVEPATSHVSVAKAYRYAETWFMLDSISDLADIRLSLMDEYGKLYRVDLQQVFYHFLPSGELPHDIDLLNFSEDMRQALAEASNCIGKLLAGD
jgi:hypothetical protein